MKKYITLLLTAILVFTSTASHADFDEVVVTIYFSGTNLDSSMWNPADSDFGRSETIATLHNAQIAQPGHHKGIVNGIVQDLNNNTFVPNWNSQLNVAQSIFNSRPACAGQCVVLNLVGFSRGGVSALHAARELYDNESSIKKINIIAFDPVPGDRLRTSEIFVLPPIADYVGFYANDERSVGFAAVVPQGSGSTQSVDLFLAPGAHTTLVGSAYRNGHRPVHGSSSSRLDPLSRTLRIVATELLGSSDSGHVRFNPDIDNSPNLDWYQGETDVNALRQQFQNQHLLPIFDSYYTFMREFSFVAPANIDLREGWTGGNCVSAGTADKARLSSRCVYTGGYNGLPIGQSDGPISGVSSLDWLDVIDGGQYRLWRIIEERGSLDTDVDGIDYSDDNCTAAANTDQTDSDSDGYGNACDADFNNDCIVNFLDFSLFSQSFLSSNAQFDTNNDGIVNFLDIGLVVDSFFSAPGPGLSTAICE